MTKDDLDAVSLREMLSYDPLTGVFVWLIRPAYKMKAGDVAGGAMRSGHLRISIKAQKHFLHRLAWLYVHGEWPSGDIDHMDGDPTNNRIANLRVVTHGMNMENQRRPNVRNKVGLLGVYWCPRNKKWRACIHFGGRKHHLGMHATPELAQAAYLAAKREHHAGCTL